jgi:hypothetical protein
MPPHTSKHQQKNKPYTTNIRNALIELEVVDITTAKRPKFGAMVKRSLALFGAFILAATAQALGDALDLQVFHTISTGLAILGIIATLASLSLGVARGAGKRSGWDRISKTMVRYRTAPTPTI